MTLKLSGKRLFFIIITAFIVITMAGGRAVSMIFSSVEQDGLFPQWGKTVLEYLSVILKLVFKSAAFAAVIYGLFRYGAKFGLWMCLVSALSFFADGAASFLYDWRFGAVNPEGAFVALLYAAAEFIFMAALIFIVFLVFDLRFRERGGKSKKAADKPKKAADKSKKATDKSKKTAAGETKRSRIYTMLFLPHGILTGYQLVSYFIDVLSKLIVYDFSITTRETLSIAAEFVLILFEYGILPVILGVFVLWGCEWLSGVTEAKNKEGKALKDKAGVTE